VLRLMGVVFKRLPEIAVPEVLPGERALVHGPAGIGDRLARVG
jgi:hypothetical protein